jgi:uncharacterized protein YgiM (DUF1202 family)
MGPAVLADTGGSGVGSPSTDSPAAAAIVATAERYLGYPYATVGDSPATGFSCIGFVHFVFAQNGVYVPGNLGAAFGSALQVAQSSLQPGDLVFFQNTVWRGISHVAIYIGAGKMIAADSFQTGVQWDTLSDSYWQQHYLGATRPLASVTGAATSNLAPGPTVAATTTPLDTQVAPGSTAVSQPTTTVSWDRAPGSTDRDAVELRPGAWVTVQRNVSVYSGPGNLYTGIDLLLPGVRATVLQIEGPWVDISYDGGDRAGWVFGSGLSAAYIDSPIGSSTSTASPTATAISTQPAVASAARDGGPQNTNAANAVPLVQVGEVAVYARPSTGSAILGTLAPGTRVAVLQARGVWTLIVLADGTAGWVAADSLASGSSGTGAAQQTPPLSDEPASGTYGSRAWTGGGRAAAVTADVLFVRSGPGLDFNILRRVHRGDRVSILAETYGWFYVELRDQSRGWVSARWIDTGGERRHVSF